MPNSKKRSDAPVDTGPKDSGYAPDTWEFDEEVTRVFDNMLERSIPQYEVMRETVLDMVDMYAPMGSTVVDLGAARGEATARLLDREGAHLRYLLVESSAPMANALRERFKNWIEGGFVDVKELDLRHEYPVQVCSVVMSVLTLQFVPIEYRQGIVSKAFKNLAPGGAFILVEKVLGQTSELDANMVKLYLKSKREQGYTKEEIDRKRLSLEGRLVPITARWNEDLLRSAGFTQIDCFWRHLNFAAWVALKD